MTTPAANTSVMLPLALLDPPRWAMRDRFDDERFVELRESMRVDGLVQNIVVTPEEDRYRIVAGHRRSEAARELGWQDIECKIVTGDALKLERLKVTENTIRHDTNPAEDAVYYHELLVELCDNDIEKLCALTRKPFAYLSDRLNLLTGDPRIVEAVRAEQIKLSVANEFNRIKSPASRFAALDTAIRFGCTTKAARELRSSYNLQYDRDQAAANGQPAPVVVPTSSTPVGPVCFVCEIAKDFHELEMLYVHSYCNKARLQELIDLMHGRTSE